MKANTADNSTFFPQTACPDLAPACARKGAGFLIFIRVLIIVAGLLLLAASGQSQISPPSDGYYGPTNVWLESWSFMNVTNWADDDGDLPLSYTNLSYSHLGNANENALVVDTNVPAWLQYGIIYPDWTNLTVDVGSLTFWFAPTSWASTNGPDDYARLFEVGDYTPDSSYGWWSVFVSPGGTNLYFAAQTNDLSSNATVYISYPISWQTNVFHCLTFTYDATNTEFYLDGVWATNGPGMTVYPGSNVLANGFFVGSSSNGLNPARGMFNSLQTYGYPLNSNDVSALYDWYYPYYLINPYNGDMFTPNGTPPTFSDTNLALLSLTVFSNTASMFVVNSTADILYEIQSKTNLTQTNWNFEGFIYGSELTNWTIASVAQNGRPTLFLRLRSWISSDGSGLPDWWEQQYGVTDPYGNPAGDGYSNLYKFQHGMNPNVFYTPAAPQGVTVNYNATTATAKISWLPSLGNVTGYTVTDSDGLTFNVSASTTSMPSLDVSAKQPDPWNYGTITTTYTVQAHYSGGDSAVSATVPLEPASFAGSISPGAQSEPVLTVQTMPANTTGIRLTEMDESALNSGSGTIFVTNFTVPISSLANGSATLPNVGTSDEHNYYWVGQAVGSDGSLSAAAYLWDDYNNYSWNASANSMTAPFYDGREQLKQNLIFKLRAAGVDKPLKFYYADTNNYYDYVMEFYDPPTNYVESSILHVTDTLYDPEYNNPYDYYEWHSSLLDPQYPFFENYLLYNFVYSSANVDSAGFLNTGAGNYTTDYVNYDLGLSSAPTWKFQAPSGTWTNAVGLLDTNSTGWICSIPLDPEYNYTSSIPSTYYENAMTVTSTSTSDNYALASGAVNLYGLPISNEKLALDAVYSGVLDINIATGSSYDFTDYYADGPVLYAGVAQPQLQTVEYDFWSPVPVWNEASSRFTEDWLPGSHYFSTTNQSQTFFMPVGGSTQVAGYAKMTLQNGYSGVYAYLGQYFDRAYKIDNGGNVTTNQTGILSPYGNFVPTEPGRAALVTMPDLDTGERGTCTVYSVSCVIDRTQGSNMDLSFNGANVATPANPATIWANNNYDRGHTVDGSDFEQDDLSVAQVANLGVPAEQQVPDGQYKTNGYPAIPCTRDLEDYFRLWLPGVAAAMKAMPASYTVQLSLSGNAQIRIFQSVEEDGGTNYLFDETTASNQVAQSASLYVGLLTSNAPIAFNVSTNFNEHFIFCGAQTGSAQIDLQVLDDNGNVLADAPTYLQINDIKDMYERWTVGDNSSIAPLSVATNANNDLPSATPFHYLTPTDTNMPYILLVHGWNMQTWEKDRFAETAYKRLYWQGYRGRFGFYRWPTGNGFSGVISAIIDGRNYDNSESNAWASATGLTNLLTSLNTNYPGHVYLMAHSMGNVVAGEALRRASSQLVNSYIAMQGAVPAHCYDSTTTTRIITSFLGLNQDDGTPNRYANYYTNGAPSYFYSSAGAGAYVNFYNTNDYALSATLWQLDQNLKPDNAVTPGYHYDSSSGFYKIIGTGPGSITYLNFPGDTYEIFAYCDESRCYALGAQADVGGVFTVARQVNLPSVWPIDTHPQIGGNAYSAHVWHSAQFRSDNMSRANFWNAILEGMRLKP